MSSNKDTQSSDQATAYKQDFYNAVNHNWYQHAVIPADQPLTGGFTDLNVQVEHHLRHDFRNLLSGEMTPSTPQLAEFKKFYALACDFPQREADGTSPLQALLQPIEDLKNLTDYNAYLVTSYHNGLTGPFKLHVQPNMKNTSEYALYLEAPDLILPDTTYYTTPNDTAKALLTTYTKTGIKLLKLVGYSDERATQRVNQSIRFDALLAQHVKSNEESADDVKRYNPLPLAKVVEQVQTLDIQKLIQTLLKATPQQVIVTDTKFFDALPNLFTSDNFELFKGWIILNAVFDAHQNLPEGFRRTGEQYQQALSGQKQAYSANRAAYYLATHYFDQVVGDYYGRKYFGEQAKNDVHEMVVQMIKIYQERLATNTWLSSSTKQRAILKLQKLTIKVGYPDQIDPFYTRLQVDTTKTFFDNIQHFDEIKVAHEFAQWGTPVNREKWDMSANVVNAYYSPDNNEIVFPAAILQAPFYDLHQSASANYGGIGAVMAHEISHAFDNNGAHFDESGNLNNWWTPADLTHFNRLSDAMITEFDGHPIAGKTVNGKLTVSENIADAGGLSCALAATKEIANPSLRDFFINWATIWRSKATLEFDQFLLSVDVHAPDKLRANIQVQNLDDFYTTFDVHPGDGMYLAPEQRVHIW